MKSGTDHSRCGAIYTKAFIEIAFVAELVAETRRHLQETGIPQQQFYGKKKKIRTSDGIIQPVVIYK
jgi:hypothetical protein